MKCQLCGGEISEAEHVLFDCVQILKRKIDHLEKELQTRPRCIVVVNDEQEGWSRKSKAKSEEYYAEMERIRQEEEYLEQIQRDQELFEELECERYDEVHSHNKIRG